jgi:hypothetical protein
MAAAALINPATAYHPHNTSYPPSYHPSQPPPSMPGMMSPEESRRPSNETETSQRQSLPSLSEVFSTAKPGPYSPSTPTNIPSSQGLPPPFSSAPQRPELPPAETRHAPHHDDKFFRYPPRPDIPAPHGPTYTLPEQREHPKPPDAAQVNGSHANTPAPMQYVPPGHLPPGQYPLTQPPISPRHAVAPPYDQPRPPMHGGDDEYAMQRHRYDPTALNRQFENWGYQDCLNKVGFD